MGPRRIGAVAGLAPAVMAVGLFVILGSGPTREAILALVGITVLAIVVGWLVGPFASGSLRADLMALVVYALIAALVYMLVATAGSAESDSPVGGASDLGALGARAIAQLLYGLLYLPFWAAFAAPFAVGWLVVVRVLRLRARLAPSRLPPLVESGRSDRLEAIRPRRIALIAAAIVLVYGLFVALLPLVLYNDPRPPWWIYRPVALFSLFAVPAVVAGIGAFRGVRPLLIAAGVVCLLQAYISFSGITLGFMVPAVVLLWLGAAERSSSGKAWPSHATLLAGVAVIGLTIAAWVSLFVFTEPRCWAGTTAPDGSMTVIEVPVDDRFVSDGGIFSSHGTFSGSPEIPTGESGCSSAEFTVLGMGISAVLAIGAVAIAATAGFRGGEVNAH